MGAALRIASRVTFLLSTQCEFSFHVPLPSTIDVDFRVMFMKEFRIIDAAHSEEQLKLRLKPNELEQYGEAFTPEFVYQVIRQLPRFRDMRVSNILSYHRTQG